MLLFSSSMFDNQNLSKPVIKLSAKAASKLKLDESFQVSIAQLEQKISATDKQTCSCDENWTGKFCNQQNYGVKGTYWFLLSTLNYLINVQHRLLISDFLPSCSHFFTSLNKQGGNFFQFILMKPRSFHTVRLLDSWERERGSTDQGKLLKDYWRLFEWRV